jgi:hypothetical protein
MRERIAQSRYLLIPYRVLTDERKAALRLHVVRKDVRSMRRKGKKLEQTSSNTKTSAEKTMDAYAQVSCRKLCDGVYNTLPREVRDIIYGHLNPPQDMRINRGVNTHYFNSDSESHWQNSRWHRVPESHWWRVDFMGEYVRREMIEFYYRSNLFLFGDNFDQLPKFRVTDQWKLGFLPADLVTNVGVQVDCGGYDFDGLIPLPDVSYNSAWDASPRPRDPPRVLLSKLEQLFGFKTGTKVSIKFFVDDEAREGTILEVQEWLCDTVLAVVLPSIRRLASVGHVLRIILTKRNSNNDYVAEQDFVLESKTFDRDAVQASFKAVSIQPIIPLVSITHDSSSNPSSWRRKSSSSRPQKRQTTLPMPMRVPTRMITKTATMNEHVWYHDAISTEDNAEKEDWD